LHLKQARGQMTRLDAVQAQLESVGSGGSRGHGIRARDFLAFDHFGERRELARNELQPLHPQRFKSEMPHAGCDLARVDQLCFHARALSSSASTIAGCWSSGGVTSIASPGCAAFTLSISFGRSRCRCSPSVRKYGTTTTRETLFASVSSAPGRSGWPPSRNAATTVSRPPLRAISAATARTASLADSILEPCANTT